VSGGRRGLYRRVRPRLVRQATWLLGPRLSGRLRGGVGRMRASSPVVGLRIRFAVAFSGVAAVVAVLVGGLGYSSAAELIRHDRTTEFNQALVNLVASTQSERLKPSDFAATDPGRERLDDRLTLSGGLELQVLNRDASVFLSGKPEQMPVSKLARKLAAEKNAGLSNSTRYTVDGDAMQVGTVSLGGSRGAVQLGQRLSATEDLLDTLRESTAVVAIAVMIAAGASGWWLAGRITRRLVRLAGAAEKVASTGRLDIQVPSAGRDEVGRLGRAFDHMLGRLAQSMDVQRRLVQDAGHELRTPLTSLRTNLAALHRIEQLPPESRAALLDDLQSETRELTVLVNELVELAADRREEEEPVEVELGRVAERVAGLARRRTGREIVVDADRTVVRGRPLALQRAITNLVENAAKFDRPEERSAAGRDPEEPITLLVRGGRISVQDRGPGLEEGDLGRIFDRFYRATSARSLPGSGLGLAIVHAVAGVHGGEVFAANRPGGGSEIGFTVAEVVPPDPDDPERPEPATEDAAPEIGSLLRP
jgi:two-component system sensor histidine kinase MprB